MNKVLTITLSLIFALTMISCTNQQAKPDVNSGNQTNATVSVGGAQTPTDAYIMLYTAVKSKQTDSIKKMMSQKTLGFAEGIAGQQKKPVDTVFENGFTATTFAAAIPQMRDERIKENMGALEVWNEKEKKWEELPFIKEADGWKLAIGDIFAGSYEKPAKGQAQIEAEASNSSQMIPYSNGNTNSAATANSAANASSLPPQKPLQMPKKPLPQ